VFGDFKIGGKVIRTVKNAGDFMLLAKEETLLQGMIDRLIEMGNECGKRQLFPVQFMIN
jgi:hypothetical protein